MLLLLSSAPVPAALFLHSIRKYLFGAVFRLFLPAFLFFLRSFPAALFPPLFLSPPAVPSHGLLFPAALPAQFLLESSVSELSIRSVFPAFVPYRE